jgi:hypothetical protein
MVENNMSEVSRSETERMNDAGVVTSPLDTPASSTVESPARSPVEGGKVEGASPSPPEPSPQPSGQWPKSAVDRVAKLTARLRQYEASGKTERPIDPNTGQQFTPAQIDAMVMERANLVASQTSFNNRCNDAASRGASKFPDWQSKLTGLTQLVDQTDARSIQQYNLFLEAALESGNAEDVIYRLGSDLNEASRVLAMSPVKMAIEVGKMGEEKSPSPSKAPKPIRPVGSTSPVTVTKPDDPERGHEMSMSDWMNARNKQATERRIR